MQGFRGRGWGYINVILKPLRQKVRMGEVLKRILMNEHLEPKKKGYHLPGGYQTGKRVKPKPDYYEKGI